MSEQPDRPYGEDVCSEQDLADELGFLRKRIELMRRHGWGGAISADDVAAALEYAVDVIVVLHAHVVELRASVARLETQHQILGPGVSANQLKS